MKTMKFDKSKMFEFAEGRHFTCYYMANGSSFEVGIYCEDKMIFFGNFIHKSEAMAWYKEMMERMMFFVENYQYMPKMKMMWYFNFAKNYFYNAYYAHLNKTFRQYNQEYKKAFMNDKAYYKKYEMTNSYQG